jgi:hypothetical protein
MSAPIVHIAELGNLRLAFGYEWGRASSLPLLDAEAKIEARLPAVAADVVVLRPDPNVPQFGLGRLPRPDKVRPSAAAIGFADALALQAVQSGCGLFAIPGGYWLVEVFDDQIPATGDQFTPDLPEALAALGETIRKTDQWPRIYVAREILDAIGEIWRAEASGSPFRSLQASLVDQGAAIETTPLAELIGGLPLQSHKPVSVLDRLRPWLFQAALAAASVTIIAGSGFYLLTRSPPPPPPVRPAPPVILAAAPPIIDTPVPVPTTLPSAWVRGCLDEFAWVDAKRPPGAWTPVAYDCDGNHLLATFERAGGVPAQLLSAYPLAGVAFSADFQTATLTMPILLPNIPPPDRALWQGDRLRRELYSLGFTLDEHMTIGAFAPPPGRIKEDRARWLQAELTISTSADLRDWGMALDEFPGLIITHLAMDPKAFWDDPASFRWTIKGFAHAP